jgi:hypothetical protein
LHGIEVAHFAMLALVLGPYVVIVLKWNPIFRSYTSG